MHNNANSCRNLNSKQWQMMSNKHIELLKWLAMCQTNRIYYIYITVSASFHHFTSYVAFFLSYRKETEHTYTHKNSWQQLETVYVHLLFSRWPWHSVSTHTLQFVSSILFAAENISVDASNTIIHGNILFASHILPRFEQI